MENKYLVYIERSNDDTCFLKLLYKVENGKLENLDEIILPNSNKLKVTLKNDYAESEINYKKNKEKIDKNTLLILNLPSNLEDKFYRLDNYNYKEYDENSVKYYTYLNLLNIEECRDYKLYQILDINDLIDDFDEFKHSDSKLLQVNIPITDRIYIEYDFNIYGQFRYNKKQDDLEIIPISADEMLSKFNVNEIESVLYTITLPGFIEIKLVAASYLSAKCEKEDYLKKSTIIQQTINKLSSNELTKKEKSELKKFLTSDSSIQLTEERKNLILNIIEKQDFFEMIKEQIIDNLFLNENSDRLNSICKKIVEENYSKIKDNENIQEKINEFYKEIDIKKKELENIISNIQSADKELKDLEENRKRQLEIKNSDKLDKLKSEIIKNENKLQELKDSIDNYETKCGKYNELVEIESEIQNKIIFHKGQMKYNEDEIKKINEQLEERKNQLNDLQEQLKIYSNQNADAYQKMLDESIDKIQKAYSDNAFEYYTTNKMFAINTEIYNEKEKEYIKSIVQNSDYNVMKINESKECIENIYDFLNKKALRKISKNDITNILLCLSQGFLTVFAGEPGVGKTSLCNILANAMGLNTKNNLSRYLEISVEKGWSSKKDLIGYYNPLTKHFDSSNKKLFDAFSILDEEEQNKKEDFPYIVLLDEANLSPMEYYWADFMNMCDFDMNSNRYINVSENYQFKIPHTLRFLATINYDHTTEILSPRLLDRAWIILIDASDADINDLKDINIENINEILPYKALRSFINESNKPLSKNVSERLKIIIEVLNDQGIFVSSRSLKMIKNYCVIGDSLFEKTNDLVALDYAVSQKILPLIRGYGEEYKKFLENFKKTELSGMKKSQNIVQSIISKGNKNMDYYQFFSR